MGKFTDRLFKTLIHIKNNLLANKKDSEFIKIFFEEIALFYKCNFGFLIEKNQLENNINTFTLSRALVSMMDGLILHRGFFESRYTALETFRVKSATF